MKQLITIPLLIVSFLANAQQNDVKRKHAFKTNMLSAIYNTLNVSYQKLNTDGNSFLIGASYMDFNDFGDNTYTYDMYNYVNYTMVEGVALTGEYRLHFSGEGFQGGYVGGFTRAMYYQRDAMNTLYVYTGQNSTTNHIKEEFNYVSAGLGFVVGYQYVVKNRITFDFFGGPVYQYLIHEDRKTRNVTTGASLDSQDATLLAERIPNRYIRGYGLRGGITVGILF